MIVQEESSMQKITISQHQMKWKKLDFKRLSHDLVYKDCMSILSYEVTRSETLKMMACKISCHSKMEITLCRKLQSDHIILFSSPVIWAWPCGLLWTMEAIMTQAWSLKVTAHRGVSPLLLLESHDCHVERNLSHPSHPRWGHHKSASPSQCTSWLQTHEQA